VCAGVALAQTGIGLAARHGTPPRLLVVSPRRARILLGAAVAAVIVVGLAAGGPSKLSHAWRDFKRPTAVALNAASLTRFGTISSNGRYQLWKVAVDATKGHVARGSGPGTYQLLWLPRAVPGVSYVQNAHSLYFETLAELGVVGLVLLVGFFIVVMGTAVASVMRLEYEQRVLAAGAAAALTTFIVSAAFDWIWQVPVLPVAFLLLAAAVMPHVGARRPRRRWPYARRGLRAAVVLASLACLVAIGVPLATATAVQRSQAAAASGNAGLALHDAQEAARLEPNAASPQLQLALIQELQGHVRLALLAAQRAVHDEPANWASWLIMSRLEAENGNAPASVVAFRHARSLNPTSPLFAREQRS
jgi:O-antigen ligase